MLFDLRGRGRRRTVQVIYLGLALLMGGGLVFFGIGGSVGGGLFDALNNDASTTNASKQIASDVRVAERATRLHPKDAAAWSNLARVRYQAAGTEGFDNATQQFTPKGITQLHSADTAWQRHLALAKTPDSHVASLMVQAYAPGGLDDPAAEVNAQEIVTDETKPPSSNLFAQLAVLAYQAGQNRKGDLASAKAVSLATKDQRDLLRTQLQQAKKQATQPATTTTTATTG